MRLVVWAQSTLNPLQKLRQPWSSLNLIQRLLQPSGCPLNLEVENGNVFRLLISHCSTTLFRRLCVGTEGFWVKWFWFLIDRISESAEAWHNSTHMEITGVLKKVITVSLKNPKSSLRHSAPFAGTEQTASIPTTEHLSFKIVENRILRSIRSKNKNVCVQTKEVIGSSCTLFAHSFIDHNSTVTSCSSLQHPAKFSSLSP